jgi:hypothetical protein
MTIFEFEADKIICVGGNGLKVTNGPKVARTVICSLRTAWPLDYLGNGTAWTWQALKGGG